MRENRIISLRRHALTLLLAATLGACGGDDVPADAGGDAGPPASDGGTLTPAAPAVIATMPSDGELDVPPDATIRVLFSRPMRPGAGSVSISSDRGPVAVGAPEWSEDGELLELTPTAPLDPSATITVDLDDGFESEAGVRVESATRFSFRVADRVAPRVVSTEPAEGATVDAELAEIALTLSEPMDARTASVRLEGPAGAELGAPRVSGTAVTIPVSGLASDAAYRVVLEGWRDLAGNALDASALGDEGALDFETGSDERAPTVLDASPSEGQLDVSAAVTTRVVLELSEPMDESAGTAELVVGDTRTTLEQRWERGGTRLVLTVSGLLGLESAHRVELTGYADLAGNALDGTVYLADGALDFTTGSSTPPYVSYTTPEEGRTDVLPADARRIAVVFSEAMDTSRTTATLVGDGRSVELSGTWSMAGTTLYLDTSTVINAGSSYELDLRAFEDATGVPLDATHDYLADGVLSFSLVPPTGERCGDALTQAQGEALPSGHRWALPALAVLADDGSASCDADGHGSDMVVRYRKTTPGAGSPGGTVLHVYGTIVSGDFDIEVREGSCDPLAEGASEDVRACLWRGVFSGANRRSDLWIDGGPGEYFVWLAQEGRESFRGGSITIEEVPLPPEGESCLAPLTTSSASHSIGAAGEHLWSLAQGAVVGLDRAVTHTGEGALACEASAEMSTDSVVAYAKTSSTSLVTVEVDAQTGSLTAAGVSVEVADACEPSSPDRDVVACQPSADQRRHRTITLDGPARDLYVWLVANKRSGIRRLSPETFLRIDEFEPGLGDTCANAVPLSAGTSNAITPAGAHRAYAPSCMGGSAGVTWYRYTASERLGIVRTTSSHVSAVVERATGRELRCGDDTAAGAAVVVPPGTEVCLALGSSGAPTALTIEELDYGGVLGAETELGVTGTTSLSPRWIAATDSSLFVRSSVTGLLSAPVAGGAPYTSATVPSSTGNAGLLAPDGSIVTLSTSTSASAARVLRLVASDGTLVAPPAAIDSAPAGGYPARRIDALTRDEASFITATVGDPTVFYTVPFAGGQAVEIGRNAALTDVAGIAADATYLYVAGTVGGVEGVYRLQRDTLANDAQAPVALASGMGLASDRVAMVVDSTTAAGALYFRAESPADVWLVLEPGAASPRWAGRVWQARESRADTGLAYDPARSALYLVDTSESSGRWLRLE